MADMRHGMGSQSGLDDGMSEGDVCSLEQPEEAPNLNDAEKAALAYADISATNHFAIGEETFARLRTYYSEAEVIELGLHIAYFVGFEEQSSFSRAFKRWTGTSPKDYRQALTSGLEGD